MRKKKRMNDKGFSLVEVIVVMAIIGILTVTLTPRLTQYIEKARKASDQDVVNTIYTVAKLADVLNPIDDNAKLGLGNEASEKAFYITTDGKTWTLASQYDKIASKGELPEEFLKELYNSLDSFKLKSEEVTKTTQITIGKDNNKRLYVFLDYDGDGFKGADDYVIPDDAAVPTPTGASGS